MKKILRVGFDLDGVILYNPIRIFRAAANKILKPVKVALLHQKKDNFYLPGTELEKFIWKIIHSSSFRLNRGYDELITLSRNKNVELYIITGRYGFLSGDFSNWLKKISAGKYFKASYINRNNLQPDKFKEEMIKKLKLNYFVEDNYNIIEKLNEHTGAKILWLTNIVDRNIEYKFKFYSLKEIALFLKKTAGLY